LKLLFDANLSPKLAVRLSVLFPGSLHVFATGMEKFTPDENIWTYAAAHGFAIVTADGDFVRMAEKRGAPPHVVRLENCNYKTTIVTGVLRNNAIRIAELEQSDRALLILRNPA
jgi:predicted nuclease of predicted toxin-antitoxin system